MRNVYPFSRLLFRLSSLPLVAMVCAVSLSAAPESTERRVRQQPTIPEGYTELPFEETVAEPKPTAEDQKRGYLLFTRPITEPVHANTRPIESERLHGALNAFATPGEWEPVTLGIYPLRDLKNFRLQVSDLLDPEGNKIERSQMTVRLQTYWNMGYPRYASRETYRLVPELLERVDVHSSPAKECQRWWIQVHVPEGTKAGIYKGKVTLKDDGFAQVVEIPLTFRVLGFALKQDPEKHYSAYYRPHDRPTYKGKDEAFYQKASANEFQAMRDYGIDQFPTIYLVTNKDTSKIVIQHEEEIPRLVAAGMKGRIPVLGGNAIARIYREMTPGGKRGSHWKIDKMPPPEFYQRLTKMFSDFKKDCEERGLPEMICCPLDEVAASHKEFGIKVFKAIHDAGITTYITKFPTAPDALGYAPYVDVWCSQPYAIPYEKIVTQKRHEYWSYPNHNAGERKNRRVMCKGGRMTYGFGFWRSGYTTLIPWHWSWTMAPDPFDYLRSVRSGCGMRIDEKAEVIPAIYWECFREGRDDARYLYTLQQAVFERDGSKDAQCQEQVKKAKQLLQENWNAIQVQQRYLADGMWPSQEFTARRWKLASMIEKLLAFPTVKQGNAPSVLVDSITVEHKADTEKVLEQAMAKGIVTTRDLGGDFTQWKNGTVEGEIVLAPDASPDKKTSLQWQVQVDHKKGDNPDYLVGWPRVRRVFSKGELDLSNYDFIEFMIRVDSDRDEVADDKTLLGISIGNFGEPGRLYEMRKDLGDVQRVWIPLRFSIKKMMDTTALGIEPWKNIKSLQFFIAEADYLDRTKITFEVGSVKLLASSKPLIAKVEAARHLLLPAAHFGTSFEALGLSSSKKGSHRMTASLLDAAGEVVVSQKQGLLEGSQMVLDIAKLKPGSYTLKTSITSAKGELCSESSQTVEAIEGPFYNE
ncbi:MAG: DUF6067 family protein [Verrucomicrobiales bacterium]|nr:DUF6067 family protein [Verrucomicrobiales bacterium]